VRRWIFAAVALGALVPSNIAVVLVGPTPEARASTGRAGSPAGGLSIQGSPRSLGPRQWIHTDDVMPFSIDGRPLGSGGTVTISALAQSWANADDTCLQVAFAAPAFPSAALRSAWVAAGLSTAPRAAQASGACAENIPGGGALAGQPKDGAARVLARGQGVINVTSLSTRPSTLARELVSGHTGNTMFDEAVAQGSYPNPGFERALLLLQLPTLGSTRAFQVALLHALPLIPGVVALGHQRSALGKPGIGFAATKAHDSASVVLNPRSGLLEEIRNVPAGGMFFTVGASAFWNPYAPHTSESTSPSSISLEVLHSDPVGTQTVVYTAPEFAFPL
jgi:hypothetical protein